MKRLLLALLLATTFAIALGLTAYYYGPGYVVFSYADYSIETSLIFMLGVLAIVFFLLHYAIRVLSVLLHIPDYLGLRYSKRQAEKARNALVKGLIEMSEGRFSQAEKILLKQASHSDTALLNYLIAARSAQQQGAYDRRDEYLRLAHESTPSADIAIGITQAELQLAHQQYEQALATLNHLTTISPRHGYVKKLLGRVYQQLGDWDSLVNLLDDLRKSHMLSEDKYSELEVEAYSGLLNNILKQSDQQRVRDVWQKIPKKLKDQPEIIKLYAMHLMAEHLDDEAEPLLRNFLSHHWRESLVLLYAQLNTSNPQKQLESAETWLHGHSRSAALLLVLGTLAIKSKLWGKARNYLETSIGIKPYAESYLHLAMLLEEKMDEPEKAQKYYQQGLKLAIKEQQIQSDISDTSPTDKSSAPMLKLIQ